MEIKQILENPVAFAKLVGKIAPFDYQIDIVKSKSKRIIFKAGRQVGKSTIVALKTLHRAIMEPDQTILVLAPTERQAKILFTKIREMAAAHPFVNSMIVTERADYLRFKSNSEIYCLPSGNTGATVRGFSATLIVCDEAAFIPDEVFVAIEPSLAATNGDLILISTPFGKRGRFWNAWNSDQWEKYSVKSTDSPLISEEWVSEYSQGKTEMEIKQEVYAEFIEEADTFFTRDEILGIIGETLRNFNSPYEWEEFFKNNKELLQI